jgi:hypothetical protein
MLFRHPFPSRLDHSRGVYALARAARPRDRALHVAALAHDLGHGPFSHLTEPLMIETLGINHEQRSTRLLDQVRAALPPAVTRQIAWLDWDEVAALILGETSDGRGALLNGQIDYDNLDNVARFLLAGGLGRPGFDGRQVARALRLAPPSPSADAHSAPLSRSSRVVLLPDGAEGAQAWLNDRTTVYSFLREGHRNLSMHAMLRKAVDLAAQADALPVGFFDMTDSAALTYLGRRERSGQALLVEQVMRDSLFVCAWEAEIPRDGSAIMRLVGSRRDRNALEETLAAEAGLAPHEVIVEAVPKSAQRELPPLLTAHGSEASARVPQAPQEDEAPTNFHLFVDPGAGRDYQRRLRMATERRLGALGAFPLPLPTALHE